MSYVALVVAGVVAAGSITYGAVKQGQANKAMRNAKRPTYQTPDTENENTALLEYLAGQGLSDNTKSFALNNADRGMTASLDAILKGGGDVNQVDKVYDKYLTNVSALSVADDQARLRNIYGLIQQRQRISDFSDKEFLYNEDGPYKDKMQAAAQQKAYGQSLIQQGIGIAGTAGAGYAGAKNAGSGYGGGNSGGGNNFKTTGGVDPNTTFWKGGDNNYYKNNKDGYFGGGDGSGVGLNYANWNRSSGNSLSTGIYLGNGYSNESLTPYQQMVIANLLGNNK
jgi:hypothetical protein